MTDKAKILVVEDEVVVANLMATMLRYAGFDVQVATSGREGMEQATENKFDLITLDLDLGDADGFEIFCDLKQRHISYRTPIVFVTGRASDQCRQQAMDLGAADFIAKPFDFADFKARITSAVQRTVYSS